jgi:hypothetical protein
MAQVVCSTCGKTFQRLDYKNKTASPSEQQKYQCFDCALESITHGYAPEEADLNTALIISREMTQIESDILDENLRSVETGTAPNYDRIFAYNEPEYDDPYWCYECNKDIAFCECDD